MPDPIVDVPPEPSRAPRRRIKCEFCECELSPDGDVLRRGAKARALMDLEDEHAKLTARVHTLTTDVETLTAKLAALPPAPATRKPWRDIGDDDDGE